MRPCSHLTIFLFGKGTLAQDYASPDECLACWVTETCTLISLSHLSKSAFSSRWQHKLRRRPKSAAIRSSLLRWRRQIPHCTQGLWHMLRHRGTVACCVQHPMPSAMSLLTFCRAAAQRQTNSPLRGRQWPMMWAHTLLGCLFLGDSPEKRRGMGRKLHHLNSSLL